jgi:hypothetical protein
MEGATGSASTALPVDASNLVLEVEKAAGEDAFAIPPLTLMLLKVVCAWLAVAERRTATARAQIRFTARLLPGFDCATNAPSLSPRPLDVLAKDVRREQKLRCQEQRSELLTLEQWISLDSR